MNKRLFVFFGLWTAVAGAAYPSLSGVELASGQPKTLAVPAGSKALVIAFLSSHCPCSQAHEATLRELVKAHPEVTFVGVHSNGDEASTTAAKHFQSAALPFPVLQDEHAALANQYGALKTPHVFVLSPSGETLYAGGVDDSRHPESAHRHYLADALKAIAAGQTPEVRQARALGCIIAR